MLRIREVRDACSNGTVVPNLGENPGLVSDCVTLLTTRDVLRGTASLNWSATTTIASWNGINVTGTPGRVTRLDLSVRGLTGIIPPALAGLSALVTLDLSDNDLTGETPEDLARLRSLETLRLSGNNLTGCIPMALMSVATNDLGSLGLPGCVEGGPVPAPEGVTTMTPTPLAVPEQTPTPTSVPTQTPTPASVPTQTPTRLPCLLRVSIARTYGPVVARVIEPPCGPVDGLLSPLGLRVKHLLSVEQGPVG